MQGFRIEIVVASVLGTMRVDITAEVGRPDRQYRGQQARLLDPRLVEGGRLPRGGTDVAAVGGTVSLGWRRTGFRATIQGMPSKREIVRRAAEIWRWLIGAYLTVAAVVVVWQLTGTLATDLLPEEVRQAELFFRIVSVLVALWSAWRLRQTVHRQTAIIEGMRSDLHWMRSDLKKTMTFIRTRFPETQSEEPHEERQGQDNDDRE